MYPMGQLQELACWRDLQIAFAPHGSTLHASLQVPCTHLCGSPQSLSVLQAGLGERLKVGLGERLQGAELGVHSGGHLQAAIGITDEDKNALENLYFEKMANKKLRRYKQLLLGTW